MPQPKRKLAVGICTNCGVNETQTSLWRTGKDRARLCNACGLYFQTHQQNRPAGTGKAAKKQAPNPPRKRIVKKEAGESGDDEASSNSDDSSLSARGTRTPSPPRVSRALKRPQDKVRQSTEDPMSDSGVYPRSHPRARLPRQEPRPRSAPPVKRRPKSTSLDIFSDSTAQEEATKSDIAMLRSANFARALAERDAASDSYLRGPFTSNNIPETSIRLEFWNKLGAAPKFGYGGLSMLRTNSAPHNMALSQNASPSLQQYRSPSDATFSNFSPASERADDNFSATGGDFSDVETNSNGKRRRWDVDAPLISSRLPSSPPVASDSGTTSTPAGGKSKVVAGLADDIGDMNIYAAAGTASKSEDTTAAPHPPGLITPPQNTSSTLPRTSPGGSISDHHLSPRASMSIPRPNLQRSPSDLSILLDAAAESDYEEGSSAKRRRSNDMRGQKMEGIIMESSTTTSTSSPPVSPPDGGAARRPSYEKISPKLTNAVPVGSSGSSSGSGIHHPTPVLSNIATGALLSPSSNTQPRASSPLRASFGPDHHPPAPLRKSHLSETA